MHFKPIMNLGWALIAWLMLSWAPGLTAAWPVHLDSDDPRLFNLSEHTAIEELSSDLSGKVFNRQQQVIPTMHKPELRILPLGASITRGEKSSSMNGYRKPLRDQLRFDGWDVNMVGSKVDGSMKDNNHEGTGGDLVTQVHQRSKNSYPYKPNVVLINAGTNDCNQAGNAIDQIGSRMEALINDLWGAPDMQNTVIILSSVLPTSNQVCQPQRDAVNGQYATLVDRLQQEGRPIIWKDLGWMKLEEGIGPDGVHPDDHGYDMMARLWYFAINEAWFQGMIKDPVPWDEGSGDGEGADTSCWPTPGSGTYAGSLTQKGSGLGDGIYMHSSVEQGVIWEQDSVWDRDQWMFARLWSSGRDDLLGWYRETDDSPITYAVWKNTFGSGPTGQFFTKLGDMPTPFYCIPRGVRWVDLNSDGRDDFCCIYGNGDLHCSINNGDGTDDRWPSFTSLGMIKQNEGWPQANIRLADIDGDGRTDYCVLKDNGSIDCWRNGGTNDFPEFWQPLGTRFTGKGFDDLRGVRFEDINGDGRDDWLWVADDGRTTTWTNSRSCAQGRDGDGLNVAWRQGHNKDQPNEGWTHGGMGGFASSGLRNRIHFARIMGGFSPQTSIGMRPLLDYVFMEHELLENGSHRFRMRLWYNTGSGATKLEADGNKYCNMMGHPDGRMDYVWTLSNGQLTIYPNIGKKSISGDESFWGESEIIFKPGSDLNLNRKTLHLADWDGDGVCDIIYVDGNSINTIPHVWINQYAKVGRWEWEHLENPNSALHCNNGDGPGIHDISVRFADLDGNGFDDYLCIDKDGRTTAFLHGPGGWVDYGQVKRAEGADRANIRWEDVNGDGRADMIWIDKFDGHGTVWYNNDEFPGGVDPGSGSTFHWLPQGTLFDGHTAGTCVYYPDLDGDGRADYHSILGTWTNQAETWFNRCGGGRSEDAQGDDGPISDPVLPKVASNFHWFDWNRPNFVAMGDSYAAGIGARAGTKEKAIHDDYDEEGKCSKYRGASAHYLAREDKVGSRLHHIACTGAIVDQFYDSNGKTNQMPQWFRETVALKVWTVGWGTFSFTGNDVGFSDIATWCLYLNWPNKCEANIAVAERKMDDPAFAARLKNTLWRAGRMLDEDFGGASDCVPEERTENCQTRAWHDFELFVTGYEQFFNAERDDCKIEGIPKMGGLRRPLSGEEGKAHRARLNALVVRLNGIIQESVAWVQEQSSYPHDRDNPNVPEHQKVSQSYTYIDSDALFEGHRHCEDNGRPIGRWSEGWFLECCGPDRPRAEPQGADDDDDDDDGELPDGECKNDEGDLEIDPEDFDEDHELQAFFDSCDPNAGDVHGELCLYMHEGFSTSVLKDYLMKGLHPKSAGHLAQANAIWAKIQEYAPR